MTITEKIAFRTAKREKIHARITTDREELVKLDKEISMLEALDIRAMLQEIDIPFEEVRRIIQEMSPAPKDAPDPAGKHEKESKT